MSAQQQMLVEARPTGVPATSVKILMHFDGATGSQSFVDSAGGSLIFVADDATETVQPGMAAFGSGGIALPTVNGGITAVFPGYLSLSGVFTVEFIWKTGSTPTSGFAVFLAASSGTAPSGEQFLLFRCLSGVLEWYGGVYGVSDTRYTFPGFTFSANTSYAIAVTRDSSNVLRGFVNGVVSTTTYTTNANWTRVGCPLQIGSTHNHPAGSASAALNGMDELRITQTCLYTASYTPATAAFPNP